MIIELALRIFAFGRAALALELLYVKDVLSHLGHVFESDGVEVGTNDPEAHRLIHGIGDIVHGAIEVGVDNSGAYSAIASASAPRTGRTLGLSPCRAQDKGDVGGPDDQGAR